MNEWGLCTLHGNGRWLVCANADNCRIVTGSLTAIFGFMLGLPGHIDDAISWQGWLSTVGLTKWVAPAFFFGDDNDCCIRLVVAVG